MQVRQKLGALDRACRPLTCALSPVPCLLEQICVPVESASPLVMSNQKEVLRCFTVLGMRPAAGWG